MILSVNSSLLTFRQHNYNVFLLNVRKQYVTCPSFRMLMSYYRSHSVDETVVMQKSISSYFEPKPGSSTRSDVPSTAEEADSDTTSSKSSAKEQPPTLTTLSSSNQQGPPYPDIGNISVESLQQDKVKRDLLTQPSWENVAKYKFPLR